MGHPVQGFANYFNSVPPPCMCFLVSVMYSLIREKNMRKISKKNKIAVSVIRESRVGVDSQFFLRQVCPNDFFYPLIQHYTAQHCVLISYTLPVRIIYNQQ